MRDAGILLMGLGLAALIAGQIGNLVQGRRQVVYGIEGEHLRPKPRTFLLAGALAAVALFLLGGVFVGLSAL
ncbi:hypothetical protein ACFFGH_28735 [Lysobacter korlensis]|uniref:Uncharacterized protein n=1 Tax=Lysobacter korlensis TaxID=553636 RepID=A0ABV6S131_9GAMM